MLIGSGCRITPSKCLCLVDGQCMHGNKGRVQIWWSTTGEEITAGIGVYCVHMDK